ncbi:MAG TPA: nucleotidyltransferase family protein [Rhodospirillales bacterium]|nr:nucleotidyltransferase family protein [Rhodospirillales bacterium]
MAITSNKAAGRTHALLLAGGLGTRLQPLTLTVPKCLVPIGGKTLLDYWIDNLTRAGVDYARINTHHLAPLVRQEIADINSKGGLKLDDSPEPTLLGSAGTVSNNSDLADGATDVLIIYSDNLSDVDLADFLAYHRAQQAPLTMLLFHATNPSACGIAELDTNNTIINFVEKPEHPKSDLANAGLYALSADAYREIVEMGGFDLAFDVLPKFIGRMKGYIFDGYHRDIGNLDSLRQAEDDVKSGVFRSTSTDR